MRNATFDRLFVFGIPLIGIMMAAFALFIPHSANAILTFDILFLSNHHVIATYMRLAYDSDRSQHKFLIIYLPVLITLAVIGLVFLGYISWMFTIFIHWQWFHYGKQSAGINKTFSFKLKSTEQGNWQFNRFIFYMTPVVTFLMMGSRGTTLFLGRRVFLLPVSSQIANVMGMITLLLLILWMAYQVKGWLQGKLATIHFAYLLSHHLIYLVGYVLIENLTIGWIALSVWHNLQYISYVWHFNTTHVQRNPRPYNRFMELIAQPKYVFLYAICGVVFTYFFYRGINMMARAGQPMIGLPLFFIANQIIIYHHYAVDAYIWKLRKPDIKASLGIAETIL